MRRRSKKIVTARDDCVTNWCCHREGNCLKVVKTLFISSQGMELNHLMVCTEENENLKNLKIFLVKILHEKYLASMSKGFLAEVEGETANKE